MRDYSNIMKPDLIKYTEDKGIDLKEQKRLRRVNVLKIGDLVKINEDADKKELAAKKGVSMEFIRSPNRAVPWNLLYGETRPNED